MAATNTNPGSSFNYDPQKSNTNPQHQTLTLSRQNAPDSIQASSGGGGLNSFKRKVSGAAYQDEAREAVSKRVTNNSYGYNEETISVGDIGHLINRSSVAVSHRNNNNNRNNTIGAVGADSASGDEEGRGRVGGGSLLKDRNGAWIFYIWPKDVFLMISSVHLELIYQIV